MRTYWIIILVCGLLLTGCGEKETTTATESATAPAVQPTVVEQVKQSTDNVAKKATEMVETGTQLVKDAAGDAKQAVKEVVATATEDVTAVAAVAKQKTVEIVDTSKQKVVEVKEQLKQEGSLLLNGLEKNSAPSETPGNGLFPGTIPTKAVPEVKTPIIEDKDSDTMSSAAAVATSVATPSEVTAEIQASETLIIKNKKDNVTLSHAEHGKLYGCASCHGDATPGPFELGKKTAHTMCKGCHKEQGGPTKCNDCHKK